MTGASQSERDFAKNRLAGLLDDLDQAEVLVLGKRTALLDADAVADAGFLVLIVGLHLGVGAQDLAVKGVLLAVLELDDDGLLHLVGHDVTGADLAGAGLGLVHVFLAHAASPSVGAADSPSSRSRITV